jgi:hypothetical protein
MQPTSTSPSRREKNQLAMSGKYLYAFVAIGTAVLRQRCELWYCTVQNTALGQQSRPFENLQELGWSLPDVGCMNSFAAGLSKQGQEQQL